MNAATTPPATRLRVAALGAAFLVSALVGWKSASPPPVASAGEVPAPGGKTDASRTRTAIHRGTPAAVKARLKLIREAGSPEERMRATIDLVRSLSTAELQQWMEMRWFDTGEGYDLSVFNKIAAERWRAEDLEGYVAWSAKSNNGRAYAILDQWSKDDPARLLGYLDKYGPEHEKMRWLSEVAGTHPEAMMQRLVDAASSLGPQDHMGDHYLQMALKAMAGKDPAALERLLPQLPEKYRKQGEGHLEADLILADLPGQIARLSDLPDGFQRFQTAISQSDEFPPGMIGEISGMPDSWKREMARNSHSFIRSGEAQLWLSADLEGAGFTPEECAGMRKAAVMRMSDRNPSEALRAMVEIGSTWDESDRNRVIQSAILQARNEAARDELLTLLTNDADRKHADGLIAARDRELRMLRVTEPSEWLELATAPGATDISQLLSTAGGWSPEFQADLKAQMKSLSGEQQQAMSNAIVNQMWHLPDNAFGREMALQAMNHLVRADPDGSQAGSDSLNTRHSYMSTYGVRWLASNPDEAIRWADSLPEGPTKTVVIKNMAANWMGDDPRATEQWIGKLPETLRNEVKDYVRKQK